MRNPVGKNIISLLFLSAFLLLRVANAHTLSHYLDEAHMNDCELCEMNTISNQFTPFADQSPIESENNPLVILNNNSLIYGYEAPLHCFVSPDFVYNKPPPSI